MNLRINQRSWVEDFVFLPDHTPFFTMLGSAVVGFYFLFRSWQGYRSANETTSSPEYIDFDRIRKQWPHRLRDKMDEPIQLVMITAVIILLVYGWNILFR